MPRPLAWLATAALASLGLLALTSQANDSLQVGDNKGQLDVATCSKVEGALLQRTKDGFKAVKPGDPIAAHTLLVGFPEAELVSKSGLLSVKLLLYLGETLPITEAAVTFNDSPPNNPDITVDRGVVAFKNLNAKGDSSFRIRCGKQAWELTLKDPDSMVLVARFGRHAPGTKLFQSGPKKDLKELVDEPLMHMGCLVVKGHVMVNTGSETYALHAPPGAAMISWDTDSGHSVKQLDSLPDEVKNLKAKDANLFKLGCEITAKLAAGDLAKGLDELVASDSPLKRKVAVAGMGAFDDLPRLWDALENTKHSDVREQAVMTLRNWLGRHPGQVVKLQDHLAKSKKYSAAQARTITQLLKGFDEQDRREPLVYQLLIGALESAPLPIRVLAYWHLERLAPAGQKIVYDAAANEAARRQAVTEWRRLIPEGQLPPAPKKDDGK